VQENMTIDQLTVIFLIMVFVSAEVFRSFRGKRGIIDSFEDGGLGSGMLAMNVKVTLNTGEKVSADLNCCTACMGRLGIGDEVRVSPTRNGYVVDLPWFRRGTCNNQISECAKSEIAILHKS
jgi:hypothetical protein